MVRTRIRVMIIVLALPFAVIAGRLAALQLGGDSDAEDSASIQGRHQRVLLLPPSRGAILDRRGEVLAADVLTFDLDFTLGELHPRERFLPVLERAFGLCDARCRAASGEPEPPGGPPAAECRGAVLEEQLGKVLAERSLDALVADVGAAEGPDLVLVEKIAPHLRDRVRAKLRRTGGLEALDRNVGLYFMPARDGTLELRARPREVFAKEVTLRRVASLTAEPYDSLLARVREAEEELAGAPSPWEKEVIRRGRGKRRILARDLKKDAVTEIVYRPERYPGISVVDGHRRIYPLGECGGAVTGWLRPPGPHELAEGICLDAYTLDGDLITDERFDVLRRVGCRERDGEVGQRGLEAWYDASLRGAFGVRVEELDARRVVRRQTYGSLKEPGKDLRTSLDARLQRAIYQALEERCAPRGEALAGSVVVMDLTGRAAPGGSGPPGAILATAGYPGFSADRMRDRLYLEDLTAREEIGHPFIQANRPAMVERPPGSIFKLVDAVAALESAVMWPSKDGSAVPAPLAPSTKFPGCTGSLLVGGRRLSCLGTHGEVDLIDALKASCNVYFYHLGRERLQTQVLTGWARELGFGRSSGIDLDDPGVGSDLERRVGRLPDHDLSKDEICQYVIGQGPVTATTLQVLRAVAAIALGGDRLPWPYLATPRDPETLRMRPATAAVVREGMRRAVHELHGTAYAEKYGLREYRVALKTGTAELKRATPGEDAQNCAWIAGFAPIEKPEVAFVVLLERVTYHGADAAPVLVRLLELLEEEDPGKYRLPGKQAAGAASGSGASGTARLPPSAERPAAPASEPQGDDPPEDRP